MDEFVALRHGNAGRPTKPSSCSSGRSTSIQSHMDRNEARNKQMPHRLSSGDRSATSATQSVSSSGSESTGSIPKLKASKLDSVGTITSRTTRRRTSGKVDLKEEPKLEDGLEEVPPPPPFLQRTSTTGIRERRPLRRNKSGSGLPNANSTGGRIARRNRSGIGMMGASSRREDTTDSTNRRTPRRLRRCATFDDSPKQSLEEEEPKAPTEVEAAPDRRRRLRRTQTQEAAVEGTRRSGRTSRSQRKATTPRDGSAARLRRTRSTASAMDVSSATRDKIGSSRRDARGGVRRTSADTGADGSTSGSSKEDAVKARMLKYSAKARDCKQAARPERRMSNTPAA